MSRYLQRLLGPVALAIVVLGVYTAAFAQEQARPRNPRAAERAESPPPPPPPPPSTPAPPPPQRHATPRENSGKSDAGRRAEPQRAEPQRTEPQRTEPQPRTTANSDDGGQRARRVPPTVQRRRDGDSGRAGGGGERVAVPRESRPREDRPVTGRAVPRDTVNQPPRLRPVYRLPYWYYYPYGSAFGLGSYYYDPFLWGYGYSPYGYGYPYGGHYGGYGYGSQYGGYGGYAGGGGSGQAYGIDYGSVRLKVKPRDAQVFADGYYVGRVDQFDGVFQSLKLNDGNHHIEIRADDYETLSFDLQIRFDQKITYEGELRPLTR